MKTGIAQLPLHQGRAPRWLFEKMTRLARAIIEVIVLEYGPREFLQKIADPFWFQAFGSILGFDWHSSGVTTTVCGAMKNALRGDIAYRLGLFFCGGKGAVARKTPLQIRKFSELLSINAEKLIYSSKISAKIDNSCLQDGYNLYHHMFIFTREGDWAVIQQGMNSDNRCARRYHWLSLKLKSFVRSPHSAVCCNQRHKVLNMVAKESEDCQQAVTEIVNEHPDRIFKEVKKILNMPRRHPVLNIDINPKYFYKILLKTYEQTPQDFETIINIPGVGPKTIRALALISELLYGKAPSFNDPARYSFAHGGKDGFPYPVDQVLYNNSISFLEGTIKKARLGNREKLSILKKLIYM